MKNGDWSAVTRVALDVLRAHDGVAKTSDFVAATVSEYQVSALRRRGVLDRPRNGWYVDPALPWQAKHAIRVGGVLCCVSACDSFGLPVPVDAARLLHVLLPHNAPRVRHHRDRRHYVVPGEDRDVIRHWSTEDGTRPGWRTPLIESLIALAQWVPLEWWVAAIDAALHRPRDGEPLLGPEDEQVFRALVPVQLRSALDFVDRVAESCLETLLRLAMLRRGITPFVCQFTPHARYRVDFLVGTRLIVEVDGEAFHDPEADRIRDAFLTGIGYRVVRFSYRQVVDDIEWVLDQIEAELTRP